MNTKEKINLVCYQPTYLLADLCNLLLKNKMIYLTDFPDIKNCNRFIFMRPQEYSAFKNFLNEAKIKDVPQSYINGLKNESKLLKTISNFYLEKLNNSAIIHHGVIPLPSYQFDAYDNALDMKGPKKIFGVTPFEDCYRYAAPFASDHNFEFLPIGYNSKIFTISKIKKAIKKPGQKINIGMIGKNYGTEDISLLSRSQFSTPLGYIKGEDYALYTLSLLKTLGANFKVTIVGNNWERFAQNLNKLSIENQIFSRGSSIEYKDYPKLFKSLDVLFVPTRGESGPVPIIECMSLGVPIVSSDASGIANFLAKKCNDVKCFHVDQEWSQADLFEAAKELKFIFERSMNFDSRIAIRNNIENFTLKNWAERITNYAIEEL